MNPRLRLYFAFFVLYVVWGSTYLGIRIAIATIPPFMMAGMRALLAGLLLLLFLCWRGVPLPTWSQCWRLTIVGAFLLLGGNGLVVWSEQYIDSGLAALLVSTSPLSLIVLDWLWANGPAPAPRALAGIALGIVGTALLVKPDLLQGVGEMPPLTPQTAFACAMVLTAGVSWSIGSVYQKKIQRPASVFMSSACQMIGGGLSLLLVSLLQGEFTHFSVGALSLSSVLSFSYLVCFGSIVSMSAYVWVLHNASASAVSTISFINPLVALFLGWLIAGERITTSILLGAGIILAGVVLVLRSSRR